MKDEKVIANAAPTEDGAAKMVHRQLEKWAGDFLKSSTHSES